jgi:hypothetical protein
VIRDQVIRLSSQQLSLREKKLDWMAAKFLFSLSLEWGLALAD